MSAHMVTKTVLFACVHNAGRSQMAAAWFNRLADPAKAVGISAGTQPAAAVHPVVLEVMHEVRVDLEGVVPRLLTDDIAQRASFLITLGCGEACPVVPGVKRDDWPVEDPKSLPLERVRTIRDELCARVTRLVADNHWGRERS